MVHYKTLCHGLSEYSTLIGWDMGSSPPRRAFKSFNAHLAVDYPLLIYYRAVECLNLIGGQTFWGVEELLFFNYFQLFSGKRMTNVLSWPHYSFVSLSANSKIYCFYRFFLLSHYLSRSEALFNVAIFCSSFCYFVVIVLSLFSSVSFSIVKKHPGTVLPPCGTTDYC